MDSEVTRCARAVCEKYGTSRWREALMDDLRRALSAAPAENVDEARKVLNAAADAARAAAGDALDDDHKAWGRIRDALRPYVLPSAAPRPSEEVSKDVAARVRDAAMAGGLALHQFIRGDAEVPRYIDALADALKPFFAAPQPGTVAVPVETLREIRRSAVATHTLEGYPESSCGIAKIIDALLPPPSPSEADRKRWQIDANEYACSHSKGLGTASFLAIEVAYKDALEAAWLARAEAEWRGTNGGAK